MVYVELLQLVTLVTPVRQNSRLVPDFRGDYHHHAVHESCPKRRGSVASDGGGQILLRDGVYNIWDGGEARNGFGSTNRRNWKPDTFNGAIGTSRESGRKI